MEEKATKDYKTESIAKRVIATEFKYIISIIMFLAGVVAPYYSIKTDVALIQQNHFAHMETMSKQIEDNNNIIKELQRIQVDLMKIIAVNSTKIELLDK